MIYIENDSTDPFFNFALEYYLITEKNLPEDQIFIFWRTEPTLMVGKYQNTIEEINQNYAKENGIKVVRRITGGGTIYTDMGGWQFSFITRGQSDTIDFSKYISPVIEGLKKLDVPAEFNSRNDLVIQGKKFSGNAQCMLNGYTLHHGSLLFSTDFEQMVKCLTVDDYKIISKGIKSVKERVTNISDHLTKPIDTDTFKKLMVDSIMQGSKEHYQLTDTDLARIKAIAKEKFASWEWNYGKSPKFNITKTGRFDGGKMEFKLDVNKGKITDCHIYGDFFGTMDISVLSNALIGADYEKESIKKAIAQGDIKQGFYNINVDELADIIC
ncbi:lipoate--protein ligase [Acetobacterium wieringae]|jgi:lipoate-protein ligase A|uniref:lipoate--protein ligase n=1 Tax=Acetobacterium wieringae TaxID=52694 RepID=A0A1F2PIK5_9FIRM|nr:MULTISPECIES: lipoate--protein ligase [Acetobacterium]OFV71157.1 lipoate-protein ligase LplJ [Acetobacterium wieringae]OXS26137.1 MAG: lipoate--protein ligase [Acetobacterium sp. MES1]TYC87285.1 lipoate--protein ligase [Acetobacterium wieringae]URN84489.1 lipoate--protein ligase [Acetobacterium wieringae]UYO62931.1 lipoate--protein ligase [Acetobacterium wieringae]